MRAAAKRQDARSSKRQDGRGDPITPAQRRALFAAARQRGLTTDELRDMTPTGSISMLTRADASRLLDRLNKGSRDQGTKGSRSVAPVSNRRRPRRPKGVVSLVTAAQRDKLAALRMELGWTDDHLQAWLAKRHFPEPVYVLGTDGRFICKHRPGERPLTDMQSAGDAQHVIELLKHVIHRRDHYAAKREGRRHGQKEG